MHLISPVLRRTKPWLPLHPDYPSRNVLEQGADPHSLLNFYRSLIAIRRIVPALQRGEFVPLTLPPVHILAYLRQIGGQKVLVALNFSNRPQSLEINPEIAQRQWDLLLSTGREIFEPVSTNHLNLGPLEVLLLLNMDPA